MNNPYTTTGLRQYAVGSVLTFEPDVRLNGLWWDLTGGSATLTLQDPLGVQTAIPAVIAGGIPSASWVVVPPLGGWTMAWSGTDARGRHVVSEPLGFVVIASP